jgi:hypothetical protein
MDPHLLFCDQPNYDFRCQKLDGLLGNKTDRNATHLELLELCWRSKYWNLKRQRLYTNGVLCGTKNVRTCSLISVHRPVVLSAQIFALHRRSVQCSSQSPHSCELHSVNTSRGRAVLPLTFLHKPSKLSSLISKIKEVKFNISHWVIWRKLK